ncbi:hypothetical protein AAF712_009223 [Marasmius tenuissimus]|uniref:NAD(P)-binding domain-containing protein n=1 Tax=Marasmius tenuissimus TaxID=585030 RepID=A0ABR2ZS71_9AGAR
MLFILGYIGGSVLYRLLNLPDSQSKYEFRAVVRSADKAKKLEELGVKAVVGSHSDVELIEKEAKEADVILTAADCDDLNAAEGINKGMRKRFEATGRQPILIHTSGAAVISDSAIGEYASDTIFDDTNLEQLESIPPNAPHRPVELKVLDADEEGYTKTYIVSPGIIYDGARHPLVDAGISNPRTIVFKILIPTSIKRGYGITIGKGENLWSHVHIDDLTDFYELLFKSVVDQSKSKDVPHGREGYFFLGAEESKGHQHYKETSRILFDLGKVKSTEPTPFTEEEATEYFGPMGKFIRALLSSNSRFVGNNAKRLGWKPNKTTEDFVASLAEEVQFWVRATENQ